ncbi:MAG TPA: DUF6603 domain-containing protein [Microlunatus sp.]
MTLIDLQKTLQAQVDATSSIVVSAATLTAADLSPRAGLDQLLRGHLVLGTSDLTLATTASVPAPSGSTLVVSGTANLLGASGLTVTATFSATDTGAADVQAAVSLPDGWTLGSTFGALAGEPFSELVLTKIAYVVTTSPTDTYRWNGTEEPLTQGSRLFSLAAIVGPLAVAAGLLSGGTLTSVPLGGLVDPSALSSLSSGMPDVALTGELGSPVAITRFDLSAPRIELSTGPGSDGAALAWLAFATTLNVNHQPVCDFKALLSSGASTVTFMIAPRSPGGGPRALAQPQPVGAIDPGPAPGLTPAQIIGLLGLDYTTLLPEVMVKAFEAVSLQGLTATFTLGHSIGLVSVGARIAATAPFGYGQFSIESTSLSVIAMAPIGTGPVLFTFDATAALFKDTFDAEFDLELTYDTDSREVTVAAVLAHELKLSDVVHGLSDGHVSIPDDLEITFEEFGITLAKPAGGSCAYTLYGKADAAVQLPMLGTALDGELQLVIDSAKASYQLIGGLQIGDSSFTVEVDLTADDKIITGSWVALNQDYLGIDALAAALGLAAPPIPAGLDLNLMSATISYSVTNTVLVLEAQSATYGKAVLVALKTTAWHFFSGLDVDHQISLSELPVIGPDINEVVSVGVDDIQVLVADSLDGTAATTINAELATLGPGYPQVPAAGLSGVALAMVFDAGGDKTTLSLQTPAKAKAGVSPYELPGPDGLSASAANTQFLVVAGSAGDPPPNPSAGTVWLNLQKSFGPVSFQKVGIRYADSVLYFLMNASVTAGGLSIAVLGLGVGSSLTSFTPEFTIDGLAITYAEGPVAVSGALVGSIDPVNFYGELLIEAGELMIGALGGYCEVEGHPSLFLYAVLDFPIGGPAFFFVNGLAAGFGFNRKLVIPPVDGVATFPLVQWAQGTGSPPPMDPNAIADNVVKVITELSASGVVAPSVGDYWLALGIRFTSFELVQSFALLTVEFGHQFEIALLGISTVQLPPAPAPPVAMAQLELEAVFNPTEGVLAVLGQLTPQSYVLSQACHLTGGFAMVTWFAGDLLGQFVLTLGGYSPRFTPPKGYPVVPRLGLNWQVTPQLVINGDLYFALTSSAVMAGGGLSAVWQSGSIRAWFDVEADFLLVFEPFHYYISAGIHLGASFTLDLLFTSVTISIHVGVDLEVWGPSFAGRARIDLSIISFTITFGDSSEQTDTTIGWSDFMTKLLPSSGSASRAPARTATTEAASPAIVQIVVQAGLVKRLSDADGELNWVVNGATLQLVTQTAIPTKEWTFSSNVSLKPQSPVPNTDFGAGPVGLSDTAFTSTHTITITSAEVSTFHAGPLLSNVPTALWQKRDFDAHGVPKAVDPLNSTTLDRVAVGFTLTPVVTPPDHTLPIKIADLEYTIADPIKPFTWTDATAPITDPFTDQTVWGTITATGPASVRHELLAVMAEEGWPLPTTVDVSELSSPATYDLIADPVLRLLGEQR